MTSYCVYLTAVLCIIQGLTALPSSERSERDVQTADFGRAPQGGDVVPQGIIADAMRNAIDDGVDKVTDALEKLQTRLDDAMTSVQQNYQRIEAKGDEALIQNNDKVQVLAAKFNDKLGAALANATTEAQKKCIEVAKTQGVAVITNLAKNLVRCVTHKIEEAKDIVMDLINQAKKAIALVQTTPERFSSCSQANGKSLADIVKVTVCVGKQVIAINAEAFGIIMAVAKDAILIQKMVTTIQGDMAACALQQLVQAQQDIATAVKEVTMCIANKVP